MGGWRWWVCAAALVLGACADRRQTVTTEGNLVLAPGSLDFQQVALFDGKDLDVTLRNVGRSRLDVTRAWVVASDGSYTVSLRDGQTQRVLAGDDVKVTVRFAPKVEGQSTGTLNVSTDSLASPDGRIPVGGIGVFARGLITGTVLDFGSIETQDDLTLTLHVENPSPLPVEVSGVAVGGEADEFSMQATTLSPGDIQEIPVNFHPVRVGIKNGTLAVTPCRGCGQQMVSLIGEALERALVAKPPTLDFGQLPVDRQRTVPALLQNLSDKVVTVTGAQIDPGSDVGFTLPPGLSFPFQVPARNAVLVQVPALYTVTHPGVANGGLTVSSQSKRHPTLPIPMRGAGGTAELCITPFQIDFGSQPLGSKTTATVTIENCGSVGHTLVVNSATLLGGNGQYQIGAPGLPITLAAGAQVTVQVDFRPTVAGSAPASLQIDTSEPGGPVLVQITGTGVSFPPCQLAVNPTSLDFGTVVSGMGAVLGVKITNQGSDLCALNLVSLTNDGGGTFFLPGGTFGNVVMIPGEYFTFEVAFTAPRSGGNFTGAVTIQAAGTANVVVPLTAHSAASCLIANPPFLDFGVVRPDCRPQPKQVNFLNGCTTAVTVNSATIGPGTTDGEFGFAVAPPVPKTLAPGDAVTLDLAYEVLPGIFGLQLSPLYVDNTAVTPPLLVPLVGETAFNKVTTDTFVQQSSNMEDVLFVVDNTASMLEEQPRLQAAIPAFVSAAVARGVDLHVAVTTTGIDPANPACPGGASGGEAGRFFPADNSQPRILTSASPGLTAKLQADAQVGLCAFVEQGLEAARRALSPPLVNSTDDPRTPLAPDGNLGFLRDAAALVVVFVGDEDDHSPDSPVTYARFIQAVKNVNQPQRATAFAIAPTGTPCATAGGNGTRYAQVALLTGGEVEDICALDYAPLLTDVANRAFSPQTKFPLSGTPDAGGLTVSIDGTPVATGWTYDVGSNSVIFSTVPPPGSKVRISYQKTCS